MTTPHLRPMERAGELFQTADQPFNLAGETGIDPDRIARERAALEQAAAQKVEFDRKHQTGFEF